MSEISDTTSEADKLLHRDVLFFAEKKIYKEAL